MAEEAGMSSVPPPIGGVLCCKYCSISIAPNAANLCVRCLLSEVDITEGLQKHVIIIHCPKCDRYLQPPRTWVKAQLESKELLIFCLRRLKKLNQVRLVSAELIRTEPHSRMIKVRMKLQKGFLNGAILKQSYVVEYVLQEHLCESCLSMQTNPDQWVAAVHLRQNVSHWHTFFYLEQVILKQGAAATAIKIKQMDQGIDFFFSNPSHGVKFVDFIDKVAPVRSRNDRQLVSHDPRSNNHHYRYTFSVEICPICREDLICLPPRVAASLGNLGPLVICTKVTNNLALLDPVTLRICFLNADQYWMVPFEPLLTRRQLVEYIVLDVETDSSKAKVGDCMHALADALVARVSDFGKNDTTFHIRTHLGHLLKAGDYALGYDLYGTNSKNAEVEQHKGLVLPCAILIKKRYEEKKCREPRAWKLNALDMEVDYKGIAEQEKMISEYEQFLKDLEENNDMSFNISMHRIREYQPSARASMADGDALPSVHWNHISSDEEEDSDSLSE
jgi:nonsense-mediated mRNA decay protein 3